MAGMNDFNPRSDPSIYGLPEKQRRQAEGIVTTANKERSATGIAKKLEKTPFDFKDLRFPLNVGNIPNQLHWIRFTPCIQEKSSYSVQTTGVSQADRTNRYTEGNQFQPFGLSDVAGLTVGLSALGTAEGFASGLKSAESVAELGSKVVRGGVAGGVIGAFGGVVVNAINLSRKTRRAAASIGLYMPDTVNQTIVNDYDQVSMTQALGNAGLVAQAGGSLVKGVIDAASSESLTLGQTTGSAGAAETAGALAEKSGAFGQGITDVLLFSAGYAQNPQVELLFKSIQNREFLFDFKFVPQNEAEAKAIIEIIKTFRFFSAPEIPETSRGRYFVPPSEFDIEFMLGQSRNDKLPRLSTCVLQGIDVNYGSAGQWTAFKDGMPVEISMQLRFKEVEIMHKKLIEDGF
jgi:hypothetical protein